MAYEKFIKSIESKKLLKERDEYLVFGRHCTKDYTGEVKEKGDQITIKGLGSPTIYTLETDGTYTAHAVGTNSVAGTGKDVIQKGIPDAEEIKNTSVKFTINQINLWNFMIGDIDQEYTKENGLMAKYRTKTAKSHALVQDAYIAKLITGFADCESTDATDYTKGTGVYLTPGDTYTATNTYHNILNFIDAQVQLLSERGITGKLYGEGTPKFMRYLRQALATLRTDNTKILDGREVTPYSDIDFEKTNNAKLSGVEYFILRTDDSVAFVDAIAENEAYRPEKAFADAWKGFDLYDAAIIEPKACIWTKVLGYGIE